MSINIPAHRMQVAIQHSISICRGVIFNLQCFVDGCLKSVTDILCPADLTLVSCFGELPEQAVRHTQAGRSVGFVVHGLSSLVAVLGRGLAMLDLI